MTATKWRLMAGGIGMLLLTSAYHRVHSASIMTEAADNFLAALTPEQRAKAVYPFKDEQRYDWHFIPRARKGVSLREMTPAQRHLAYALLSAGLSQSGNIKAVTIMSLEDVLRVMEKDDGERRNPEHYYFTIFGEPDAKGTWGYRVEGHHISQNFTVVEGKVAGSPSFFGANPAEVRQGPRKGLRALAGEEDRGRELLASLQPEQKKVAIVDKVAYKDILTAASRNAALTGQPNGLSAAKMTPKQRQLLDALVEEYAWNMPEQLAQSRLERFKKAGNNVHFAWAGVEERGGPHYYRIQTPMLLIEYDNTQNNANHIHAVWRDMAGDWGEDLLKEHYKASH